MQVRNQYEPTVLIYSEGKMDNKLIKHLKRVYSVNFINRQGNGGNPKLILRDCIKEIGDFDIKYCILDGDTITDTNEFNSELFTHRSKIKYKLEVIINQPCIEAVNLALLFSDTSGFQKRKCGELKKILKTKILPMDIDEYYEKYLTKKLIKQNYNLLDGKNFQKILDLFITFNDNNQSRF
jgi:hypothetical protein